MEGDSPGPERLASQLAALGVERGGILVVHASFRSVGPVDGGPGALIEALSEALGPEGTLVMPSFTDWDDDRPFDPPTDPVPGSGHRCGHLLADAGSSPQRLTPRLRGPGPLRR